MKTFSVTKALAIALLLVAAVFLVTGMVFTRKVFEKEDEFTQFGQVTFNRLSDSTLVSDATFTGVERKDGKLYS